MKCDTFLGHPVFTQQFSVFKRVGNILSAEVWNVMNEGVMLTPATAGSVTSQ